MGVMTLVPPEAVKAPGRKINLPMSIDEFKVMFEALLAPLGIRLSDLEKKVDSDMSAHGEKLHQVSIDVAELKSDVKGAEKAQIRDESRQIAKSTNIYVLLSGIFGAIIGGVFALVAVHFAGK